jgi:dimethylargininase
LEGGDILRLGRRWYVGITARTNQAGFEQFRSAVETLGHEAYPVAIRDLLHLKTGVARLDDQTVLALPALTQTFHSWGYRVLSVPAEEWHAANVIAVGRRVLMPAGHPGVSRLLAENGFEALEVDLSEFKKQDGGATCLSILLPGTEAAFGENC